MMDELDYGYNEKPKGFSAQKKQGFFSCVKKNVKTEPKKESWLQQNGLRIILIVSVAMIVFFAFNLSREYLGYSEVKEDTGYVYTFVASNGNAFIPWISSNENYSEEPIKFGDKVYISPASKLNDSLSGVELEIYCIKDENLFKQIRGYQSVGMIFKYTYVNNYYLCKDIKSAWVTG